MKSRRSPASKSGPKETPFLPSKLLTAGVITIFVLLLGSTVSEEVLTTAIYDENATLSGSEISEGPTFSVSELPFVNSLLNPCSSEATTNGYIAAEGHRASFAIEFFKFMNTCAATYKQNAQQVLDRDVIHECASLGIYNLPNTPTLQELLDMDTEEALNRIYSSLLVHSAHAYFIRHQFLTSSATCPVTIVDEGNLAEQAFILAKKQKSLACAIRLGITILGYHQNDTSAILDEKLSDLRLCSRRALRDCQVVRSIIHLLDIISQYARSELVVFTIH
ncbi:uncharacterized protein LOC118192214 isoform X2 [Stegodyphus dumicola]|nr:uncharacterized protein LOC118192214 isoform X2 [Stegodyphus dumicola]